MEILKSEQYISEKLTIQPVTKDRLSKMKEEPSADEKARQFIEDNNLVWNPKTMCYDCEGNIKVSDDIVAGGKLKIRFGKVSGYFYCSDNNLTTLEGAPNKVVGSFYCSNNKLTTLDGAPQYVEGSFTCNDNNLVSLEGAPNEVCGNFCCYNNPNLVLPKEKPSWVKGEIIR